MAILRDCRNIWGRNRQGSINFSREICLIMPLGIGVDERADEVAANGSTVVRPVNVDENIAIWQIVMRDVKFTVGFVTSSERPTANRMNLWSLVLRPWSSNTIPRAF